MNNSGQIFKWIDFRHSFFYIRDNYKRSNRSGNKIRLKSRKFTPFKFYRVYRIARFLRMSKIEKIAIWMLNMIRHIGYATVQFFEFYGKLTLLFLKSILSFRKVHTYIPQVIEQFIYIEIGRAHVWTPVTFLYLVCRLLLEKKNKYVSHTTWTATSHYSLLFLS